jgi:hypothetical protein
LLPNAIIEKPFVMADVLVTVQRYANQYAVSQVTAEP